MDEPLIFLHENSENVRLMRQDCLQMSAYRVAGVFAVLILLWILMYYVYLRGVDVMETPDVAALFATNSNFVYVLSWILLHRKFISTRVSHRVRYVPLCGFHSTLCMCEREHAWIWVCMRSCTFLLMYHFAYLKFFCLLTIFFIDLFSSIWDSVFIFSFFSSFSKFNHYAL